jgi:type IV pilus assembly protein PilM
MSIIGSKEVLGVDLGSKTIKLLELKCSGSKISVSNYAEYDIGSQGVDEKSPEERKQAYSTALKNLVFSRKFSTKNAIISVSGSSVIVRFVKFPKMSATDLEKTLEFEAEPHIPFDISDVYMDTQIIGDVEDEGQAKMETVLVASKKDTVQEKIEIVEQAGLHPMIIDVDAFALENAYEYVHRESIEKMVMLVNIGAAVTNISIVENGVSKVVRDLYTAGNSFTRAIQNELKMPADKAEALKKRFGLSVKEGGSSDQEGNIGQQVYNILLPVVKELNSEIQRSIDYFTSQQISPDMHIEKIIISGGSANLNGLPGLINADLKLPVEIFRPLKDAHVMNAKCGIDVNSPALAVITGLALRKVGDNKQK